MESKIMETRKHTTHNYKDRSIVAPSLPQPIRLTPKQLEEKRAKGLCYSCDSKYTKGHKIVEKKLLYIDCEEKEEKEQERSNEEDILQEQSLDEEQINPTISCNALAGIPTPQTIKIEGQIKKKKVIVLIDSGSTHNFILLQKNEDSHDQPIAFFSKVMRDVELKYDIILEASLCPHTSPKIF